MTKMKRTIAFVGAVVGLTLAAGSASALSSVSLIWDQSGTDTIDTATVGVGTTVTARVILQGDSPEGIGGVFVSVLFDAAGLQAISMSENSGGAAKVAMGNQFAPILPGATSIDNVGGVILGFDTTTGTSTGCIGCTVTLGSIIFQTTGGSSTVSLAVLPNGIDGIISAFGGTGGGALTTVAFGDAYVLPEPTTALLVVGGLLGLSYAGRRSVRS